MSLLPRSRLLGVLLIGLIAWGVERLIVTDREAIDSLAEALAEDLQAGRYEEVEARMEPEFKYAGKDRAATIKLLRSLMDKYQPTDLGLRLYEITIEGDIARAKGTVWGNVLARPMRVGIEAVLVRGDDGWLLREVTGGTMVR
ncbi:MAG: hypothetical protein O2894_05965 [Planctomycetota bacterium]|nr:hypothetical protein [Planctomycetota bacterium]